MASPVLQAIEARISELTPSEMLGLAAELVQCARRLSSDSPTVEWGRFQGVLTHGPEPLVYQRAERGPA